MSRIISPSKSRSIVPNNVDIEIKIDISLTPAPYTLDPFRCRWWAYKARTAEGLDELMVMPEIGVDVVVTHSPPRGAGDYTAYNNHAGSQVGLFFLFLF